MTFNRAVKICCIAFLLALAFISFLVVVLFRDAYFIFITGGLLLCAAYVRCADVPVVVR